MNYKHLRYFLAVAETGSISKAAKQLHLAPQTVSHQLGLLEEHLGTRLLERNGHKWSITDSGAIARQYAEEIFALGDELSDVLRGNNNERPLHLHVGIADGIPKHVAYHLIEPAVQLAQSVNLQCTEGKFAELSVELEKHNIDMLLTDRPMPPQLNPKAESYLLTHSSLSFMAKPELLVETPFPQCLDTMPMLMLSDEHDLAHALVAWFEKQGVEPYIKGRFDDSALLKTFARAGVGACCIPSLIEEEVAKEFGLIAFGHTNEVSESYYGIKMKRKIAHPAVEAICNLSFKADK